MASPTRCPTRRFGRTELQMPVFSVGGMRQQQMWRGLPEPGTSAGAEGFRTPENFHVTDISAACQANFEAIIEAAMARGLNHFETGELPLALPLHPIPPAAPPHPAPAPRP